MPNLSTLNRQLKAPIHRIYIVGSHSTGKTTLAKLIAAETGVKMLDEVARQVLDEMKIVSIDALRQDPFLVNAFQAKVFERQRVVEAEAGPESWVTDRSVDCVVYALAHSSATKGYIDPGVVAEWFDALRSGIVFFTRPDPALVHSDGVRETPDWEGIVRVDASIQTLLALHGIDYISITGSSIADRMAAVRGVLKWL